jgi:YfiH family protein
MLKSKNLSVHLKDDLCYIGFPKFEKTSLVKVAFTTRMGGVSKGQFASMNVSTTNGDNLDDVKKNYEILGNAVGFDFKKTVLSRQTHTDNIRIVKEDDIGKGLLKERDYDDVDGLITNISGVTLVTQFADCTPLLFLDPENKVIANVHSGWRGTVQQIGKRAVKIMQKEFGSKPANIIAAIGPCINKCCYEVDDPVYNEFAKREVFSLEKVFTKKENGKFMLDLVEANKEILLSAGIREENLDISDLCTHCNSHIFHSHRATAGKRGNLGAFITLI